MADSIESKNLGQRMAEEREEQDRQARPSRCLERVPGYSLEKDPARIGIGEDVLRNAIMDANKPYLIESLSRLLEMHIIEEQQGELGGKRYALTTYLDKAFPYWHKGFGCDHPVPLSISTQPWSAFGESGS